MSDTGLMSHLLGTDKEQMAARGFIGHLLENFVFMELKKQATWSKVKPQLLHFRTQAGQEVDIVLEDRSGKIVGIEIKASSSVKGHDFKGLHALAEATGRLFHRGIVLYTGSEIVPFGSELFALPVNALWHRDAG
jgi:hypothetical protein